MVGNVLACSSSIYDEDNCATVNIDLCMLCSCRGQSFRKVFAHLGEVRSLIPEDVRVVALTATATVHTRKAVCKLLGMVDPATKQTQHASNTFFNIIPAY